MDRTERNLLALELELEEMEAAVSSSCAASCVVDAVSAGDREFGMDCSRRLL